MYHVVPEMERERIIESFPYVLSAKVRVQQPVSSVAKIHNPCFAG